MCQVVPPPGLIASRLKSQASATLALKTTSSDTTSWRPCPRLGDRIPAAYPFSKNQEQMIGDLHYWVATAIIILACGHAGAALFHQYVLRDGLLRRMLPTRNSGKRGIVRAL